MRTTETNPAARIALTAPGHRGVTLDVYASALVPEPGAVAITVGMPDGPLTLTLTDAERSALIQALRRHDGRQGA